MWTKLSITIVGCLENQPFAPGSQLVGRTDAIFVPRDSRYERSHDPYGLNNGNLAAYEAPDILIVKDEFMQGISAISDCSSGSSRVKVANQDDVGINRYQYPSPPL